MRNFKFTGLLTLALGLALIIGNSAFTSDQSATKYYTPNGVGGYNEVTSIVQSESYQCNDSENECLVQFSNDDPQTGIKSVLSLGDFEQLP
nr:hypothetical protein [Pseudopedobacter sp.]